MIYRLYDVTSNQRIGEGDDKPICKREFCEICGLCLACFEACPLNEDGKHEWIRYTEVVN